MKSESESESESDDPEEDESDELSNEDDVDEDDEEEDLEVGSIFARFEGRWDSFFAVIGSGRLEGNDSGGSSSSEDDEELEEEDEAEGEAGRGMEEGGRGFVESVGGLDSGAGTAGVDRILMLFSDHTISVLTWPVREMGVEYTLGYRSSVRKCNNSAHVLVARGRVSTHGI